MTSHADAPIALRHRFQGCTSDRDPKATNGFSRLSDLLHTWCTSILIHVAVRIQNSLVVRSQNDTTTIRFVHPVIAF